MVQLVLHLIGDYVTQSDWMANNKTKHWFPAATHATIYTLPFLFIGSGSACLVILLTHFFIDRYRLARYVVYVKNLILGHYIKWIVRGFRFYLSDHDLDEWLIDCKQTCWENCRETGYPSERPAWLAVWLLIACDNTIHLTINYLSLRWL